MTHKHSVEVTGEDVQDAIATGLSQLGVGPGDVIVEVLDEPSRGVFGIGSRPAKVRLKLLRPPVSSVEEPSVDEVSSEIGDAIVEPEYEDASTTGLVDAIDDDDLSDDDRVAREVLAEVLEKLGIEAEITATFSETTRPDEDAPVLLNVLGSNLNVLIGRRGETLASLQYITRLITSRRIQQRANVIVDVAGYKSQRSERLEKLAKRMAGQAVNQNRSITLEPMPPNERRIVHLALRNRDDVYTKSTGEGDSRKVIIIPK
jgi:spoIIIJ-associated protein